MNDIALISVKYLKAQQFLTMHKLLGARINLVALEELHNFSSLHIKYSLRGQKESLFYGQTTFSSGVGGAGIIYLGPIY